MNEFNGRKFYGFSTYNDPDLATSTRNFEFKYARPEILEKVIQKVHYTENAKCKNKNMNWYNYCRMRIQDPQEESAVDIPEMKRDVDVDTHISEYIQASYKRVRNLTDNEVDALIDKAKHNFKHNANNTNVASSRNMSHSVYEKNENPSVERDCACQTEDYKYHGLESSSATQIAESTTSLKEINETSVPIGITQTTEISESQSQPTPLIYEATMEKIDKPQAHWVEVIEPQPKESVIETTQMKEGEETFQMDMSNMASNFGYFDMPLQAYDCTCLPAMLMNEMVLDNMRLACGPNLNSYPEHTMNTYIVEDSDLEFELYNRPNYTKYCKSRPRVEQLGTESIDENHGPTFIEIETNINDSNMNYIRNASPIQFTEITDDATEGPNEATEFKVDLSLKNIGQAANSPAECNAYSPRSTDGTKSEKSKMSTIRRRPRLSGGKDATLSRAPTPISAKTFSNESDVTVETATTATATSPKQVKTKYLSSKPPQTVQQNEKEYENGKAAPKKKIRRSPKKNISVSKSIEDLKTEKANIFTKMTCTQERIIEVLDKLRLNLLELNIPDNPYDKSKRQRNAFEFSVRFSRNFLYPLKSMVNDIKYTPSEQFTSLTSNDACARICHVYTLFLQSLQTFQKQLRYFLLDQVPQKLTTLIEMLYNATNICLEKNIFSNQDMIVDCLQQRVIKFIGFMEDMHEGRLEAARQNHRKLTLRQASSKYDLKMFMNDLNMYEPKLVPKSGDKRSKKKNIKVKKPTSTIQILPNEESRESIKEKPAEDAIATQMEDLANMRSSVLSLMKTSHTTLKAENSDPNTSLKVGTGDADVLDKRVMEALQNITKEQVRQILDPIFDGLGAALGGKNNSEMIETLVSAFNNKVFTTLEMEAQKLANKYEDSKINNNSNSNSNSKSNIANNTNSNSHSSINAKGGISQVAVNGNDNVIDNCNNGNDNNNRDVNHVIISDLSKVTRTTEISEQKNIDCCATEHNEEVADISDESLNIIKRSNSNHNNNNNSNNNNYMTNKVNKENCKEKENQSKNQSENQANYAIEYEHETENENINNSVDDEITGNMSETFSTPKIKIKMKKVSTSSDNISLNCIEADAALNLSLSEEPLILHANCDRPLEAGTNINKTKKYKKTERQKEERKREIPKEVNSVMRKASKKVVTPSRININKSKGIENIIDDNASCYSIKSVPISHQQQQAPEKIKSRVKIKHRTKKKKISRSPPPPPVVSPISCNESPQLMNEVNETSLQDPSNIHMPSHKTQMKEAIKRIENIFHIPQAKLDASNDVKTNVKAVIVKSPSGMNYVEVFRNTVPLYPNVSPFEDSDDSANVMAGGKRQITPAASKKTGHRERERKIIGKSSENNERKTTATEKKATTINDDINDASNLNERFQYKDKNNIVKKVIVSTTETTTTTTRPVTSKTKVPTTEKLKGILKTKAKSPLLTDADVDQMLQQRNEFLNLCSKNRFYSNPNYNEPWKVFSTIAEKLVNDVLGAVEEDFAKGVSKFVDDFLELETKCYF